MPLMIILQTCEELCKEPNKFFKGVFNVRISREVPRHLAILAEKRQIKLNKVVNMAFSFLIDSEETVTN